MSNKFYAIIGVFVVSSKLIAGTLAPPTFEFWVDDEIKNCKEKCERTLTLKVPPAKLGEHFAYLGQYLIDDIIKSGAIDKRVELPLLQETFILYAKLQVVASAEGDLSRSTLDTLDKIISDFVDKAEFFDSLLARDNSRESGRKLYRLQMELQRRNRSIKN